MLKNYLKIAYRNLIRNKLYSVITIAGLAIGLAGFILITLYVRNELSYDSFHEKSEDIYRLSMKFDLNGEIKNVAMSPAPFGPLMVDEYPDFLSYARFNPFPPTAISYGENNFNEHLNFADGDIFNMFSFDLVKGDPDNVLKNKNTAVLSETTAKKYFGDAEPIGKVLSFNKQIDIVVEGVFKDIPANSHLQFGFLISMSTLTDDKIFGPEALNNKHSANWYTYLLLNPGFDYTTSEKLFNEFNLKHQEEEYRAKLTPYLEPLSDIYLYSDTIYGPGITGNILYIYIFIAVALFIIILAAINFINLSTSKALYRIKEVGIRKVAGGGKKELILQFLGESIFTVFISFILSLVVVEILEPFFVEVVGKSISLNLFSDIDFLSIHFLIALFFGVISGIYPALFMSSFNISSILKGASIKSRSAVLIRKSMVVFQFVVSVALIIGTLVIFKQLNYMQEKDLGFSRDNIVYFSLNTKSAREKAELIKDELSRDPNIIASTLSNRILGGVRGAWYVEDENKKRYESTVVFVDKDYQKVFGLKIAEGRWLSDEITTDKTEAFLITKATQKIYGWEDPFKKQLDLSGFKNGRIIGVLEDFNFQSLHEEQKPIILTQNSNEYARLFMIVKIKGQNQFATINNIKEVFNRIEPNQTLEVTYLDAYLQNLYIKEQRVSKLMGGFSLIAILLGCLGLFGLASFSAAKKTKEVGIRKVLGANIPNLVFKLSWEFVKLVIIASVIAAPIIYYVMDKWLENFAYRISPGVETFLFGVLLALFIALVTVSYHSVKAATSNPVKSLRYE